MASYLVTGAAGFIGGRVAHLLLDAGHEVIGVDNLNAAYDVRVKEYRLAALQGRPGFAFHRVDIADRGALGGMLDNLTRRPGKAGLDAVINLAARAGVRQSVLDPWAYMEANLAGTLNLLEACRQYAIPKFVLASTSSVYGKEAPLPTPETASSDLPLQPYAASKKAAEVLCHTYHYLYGLDVTVFRYFTVYGPAGRPDMVMFRFTQWLCEGKIVKVNGDGEQTRGFTFVDDVARGTLLGLKPLGYEVINLGGHECLKVNDLIRMLEELTHQRASVEYLPLHPADMLANWADISKARRLLGWEPQVSLIEGVSRLVAWYQAERSWASQVDTG
ncbi:MAG: SDR family NAD(P)-dependent oxidoreductase [Anaerolineales bacterium]|nr:SDR family NAD(P)-dependent oxidoreductase [Anaerolineales bacterium]